MPKPREGETAAKRLTAKKRRRREGAAPKRGKKRSYNSYSSYIYKILKQVHPDTGISNKAMAIVNAFVADMLERIAVEAGRLAKYNRRNTIASREVQTAARLVLPGELAKHAVSEGTKAVTKYNAHYDQLRAQAQAMIERGRQ